VAVLVVVANAPFKRVIPAVGAELRSAPRWGRAKRATLEFDQALESKIGSWSAVSAPFVDEHDACLPATNVLRAYSWPKRLALVAPTRSREPTPRPPRTTLACRRPLTLPTQPRLSARRFQEWAAHAAAHARAAIECLRFSLSLGLSETLCNWCGLIAAG